MENYNMKLTETQQKYQHYDQVILINANILQVKKILPFDQSRKMEQAKFTYSALGKASEIQTKKHVYALKALNLSNKIDK